MTGLMVQRLAWAYRVGRELAQCLRRRGHRLSAVVCGSGARAVVEADREISYEHVFFADSLYDDGGQEVTPQRIAEFERRYALDSIWRVIGSDRLLIYSFLNSRHFTYRKPKPNDYLLSVCLEGSRRVREFLDKCEPEWVLAPTVSDLVTYLLYLECRYREVPFYTVSHAGFGQYFYIGDDEFMRSKEIWTRYRELRDSPEASHRYRDACELHAMMVRYDPEARRPALRESGRGISLERWRQFLSATVLLPARLGRGIVRKPRGMDMENIWVPSNSRANQVRNVWINYRETLVDTDNQGAWPRDVGRIGFDYIFYPLQFEPELDIMVWAPEFSNQIELCRRVAMALPDGIRLLVKEHPEMVSSRRRGYYAKLAGLPNVEMIHSSVPAHDVFMSARCRAVVVLSSTAGFEAAAMGRPVVVLAPVQYEVLPSVQRATTLEETVSILTRVCNDPGEADVNSIRRGCIAYLAATMEHCFESDYVKVWTEGKGQLRAETIVEEIERRLRKDLERDRTEVSVNNRTAS